MSAPDYPSEFIETCPGVFVRWRAVIRVAVQDPPVVNKDRPPLITRLTCHRREHFLSPRPIGEVLADISARSAAWQRAKEFDQAAAQEALREGVPS
jgi:hypothetical protein